MQTKVATHVGTVCLLSKKPWFYAGLRLFCEIWIFRIAWHKKSCYTYDDKTGTYYANGNLLKTGIIAKGLKLNDVEPGTIFKINNE